MQRDDIIARLKSLRTQLEAEGVAHLALFGSRARGDSRDDSDVDLLIEVVPARKFSLIDLLGVEEIAAKATGLEANAFMRRSLDESFIRSIHQDIVEVF